MASAWSPACITRRSHLTMPTSSTCLKNSSEGSFPVASTARMTPKLYTSHLAVNLSVWWYSGAMYPHVPARFDAVTCVCASGIAFASPKSAMRGSRSSSSRMFAGFRSRWMICGLYSIPSATPTATRRRSGHESPTTAPLLLPSSPAPAPPLRAL
nr:unnamed protein product [Digitaria exilis]